MRNKVQIVDENGFIYEKDINVKYLNNYIEFIKYNTNFYEVEIEPKELKIVENGKILKVFRL